eukprot:COSAG01_NODE_8016_length_2952_cov_4.907816_1_plen_65_part_10
MKGGGGGGGGAHPGPCLALEPPGARGNGGRGGQMDAAGSGALLRHCVGLGESLLQPLRKNGARFL